MTWRDGLLSVLIGAIIGLTVVHYEQADDIHDLEQRLDLQRVCIEALEDNVQILNDTLGMEW